MKTTNVEDGVSAWSYKHVVGRGILLAGLALAACGPQGPTTELPAAGAPEHSTGPAAIEQSARSARAPREILVRASEWRFDPATIRLVAGQPVRLVFKNLGKIPHDIAIVGMPDECPEAEGHSEAAEHGASAMASAHHGHGAAAGPDPGGATVHAIAAAGEVGTAEFTPTRPGTYEMVCTMTGHKDAGMAGQVVVG